MSVRTDRATVVAAFAGFGVFWGAWGAAFPRIRRTSHVSMPVGRGANFHFPR